MLERLGKSVKIQSALGVLAGLACVGAFALMGCDSVTDCDCEDEIDDLLNRRGTPSNFDISESADYNRHEYTYTNANGSTDTYVFEWGDEDSDGNTIDVCCKQTITHSDGGNGGTDDSAPDANGAPVANAVTATTTKNTSVKINVKSNDTDPDNDSLEVSSVTQPNHGTTELETDDRVTYTPDNDYTGSDTFTYRVCDPGNLCDTGTVTVTVN